jgi:prepilin-type N-terminal cleavage/methylation domain-containing protein
MRNRKGLSLIEILVVLIITGILAACVSASVIGGYYMLKQAEHKSRAMSITHVKLQEYLARSYDNLTPDSYSGTESNISDAFYRTRDNTYFNWTVNVTQGDESGIPYKNVTVETLYTEVNTKGVPVSAKTIRLSNLIPYPLIHIQANRKDDPVSDPAPHTNGVYKSTWALADYRWGNITREPSVLSFNYSVAKDVIVMYNLAINYNTTKPSPDPTHTVFTRCVLNDNITQTQGIVTRTPILTQIFINNILQVNNVPRGPHSLQIQWAQENATDVYLRAYDVTIIAFEHKI